MRFTCSIPGRRQKVMLFSELPPYITCTPPAGMEKSPVGGGDGDTETGEGEGGGGDSGDGEGDDSEGGNGGDADGPRTPQSWQSEPRLQKS